MTKTLRNALAAPHIFPFEPDPQLEYSPEGIKRLSMLIQATLKIRKWSVRKFAETANIAPSTASKYINGKVIKPEEKILKAITPLIYKAFAFTDKVYVDTNITYSDWLELAHIATKNFKQGCYMTLEEMIASAMKKNNLSQDQIEIELLKMQEAETVTIDINRFQEIQEGRVRNITEDELRQIRLLVDLEETAYSETEWILAFLESQPKTNPAYDWQGEKLDKLNGTK
ncbi:helix-turn-helix transcriptional regulator [Nostoc sp. UHCC 0702]|nr:helix-turn-helix transcriptional regulator [Nostoc sp. UHCC 0702]